MNIDDILNELSRDTTGQKCSPKRETDIFGIEFP